MNMTIQMEVGVSLEWNWDLETMDRYIDVQKVIQFEIVCVEWCIAIFELMMFYVFISELLNDKTKIKRNIWRELFT